MAIVRETGTQTATFASTTTTWTVTKPTGTVTGDTLVAGLNLSATTTVTPPTNWTLVKQGGGANNLRLYYLVAGGSEPADYTWTLSNARSGDMFCARYSGVDNTTPEDVAASIATSTSNSVTATGLITATNGAMLLYVGGACWSYTITTPSGMSEVCSTAVKMGNNLDDETRATAGATGDRTGTMSSTDVWAAILWALRPAATFPPVPGYINRQSQYAGYRM